MGEPMQELVIPLDRRSAEPLYVQLARGLENLISDGTIAHGDRLESETSLATRLGLSRPTIRQGIQELADKGLVVRKRGVGTQVVHPNGSPQAAVTGIVGVVVPDMSNPFFAGIARAIEQRARSQGYLLIAADTDEDLTTERAILAQLPDRADGLILAAPRAGDEELTGLLSRTSNVVLINRNIPRAAAVNVDVATGMSQAVAHLRALGHRRIGYVAGPKESRAGEIMAACLREAADEHGCELHMLANVSPNHAGGFAAADVVLASEVTAVAAHNDLIAFGLISRLVERGVDVPSEISVVGCDDVPFSQMLNPGLTTVMIDPQLIGRAAVDVLMEQLKHDHDISEVARTIESRLVVRASTAVPGNSRGAPAQ